MTKQGLEAGLTAANVFVGTLGCESLWETD